MSPMKGDKITLSQGQLQRYRVMSLVEAGKITLKEAATFGGVGSVGPTRLVGPAGRQKDEGESFRG